MMLNCEKTTRLVSEGLDRELSLGERFGLQFHILICSACRNLMRQMSLIRRAVSLYASADIDHLSMSDEGSTGTSGGDK